MRPLSEQTHLVTGATQGIGREAARALARQGARVLVTGRDEAKGRAVVEELRAETGNPRIELALVDFSSFRSVRAFIENVRSRVERLDVLINNAGGYFPTRKETEDGHEWTFQVNHLGYFMTTLGLLDRLRAAGTARVVCVSSDAHMAGKVDFDDLDRRKSWHGFRAYATSKLMNILFAREAARRFPGAIAVNAVHPGVVASGFGLAEGGIINLWYTVAKPFLKSPEQGADTAVWLALSPDVDGVTGRYFCQRKEHRALPASRDMELALRLWDESERLTGMSLPG